METNLRPMSASLVLDRTFQIYRTHFAKLAGICIPLPAALLLLQLVFLRVGYPPSRTTFVGNPWLFWTTTLEFFAAWILTYIIAHALTGGATVYAVSKLHLGQNVSIAESYRKTLPRFGTVLRIAWNIFLRVAGAGLVSYIVCALCIVGLVALAEMASNGKAQSFVVVVVILLGLTPLLGGIYWVLYLYAKNCLAVPACLVEGLPARAALKRSRFLARGSTGRIILVYFLMVALGLVLSIVFWLPQKLYVSFPHSSFVISILLQSVGSFFAGALAGPVATIAISLMYYDQRIRKEAFDLQWMMQSMVQPATAVSTEAVSAASTSA